MTNNALQKTPLDTAPLPDAEQQKVWQQNTAAHDELATYHEKACSYIAKPACRKFYQKLITSILAHNGLTLQNARIVEFGCGTGNFAALFSEYQPQHYTGIDISPAMIAKSKARNLPAFCEFQCGSIEEYLDTLIAKGEKVDLVFSSSVIHHLYDIGGLFSRLQHVLSPQGVYLGVHEPMLAPLKLNPTSRALILDNILATLAGYDDYKKPFLQRLGEVFRKILRRKPANKEHNHDWVDYQFNNPDFSPIYLAMEAEKAKLGARCYPYSYFRFPILDKIFGAERNHFAFVTFRKP